MRHVVVYIFYGYDMVRLLIILMIGIEASGLLFSQTISNVRTEVKNGRVIILYNLSGNDIETYNISITATRSDGTSITPQKIAGNLSEISPGSDKLIYWEPQLEGLPVEGWTDLSSYSCWT